MTKRKFDAIVGYSLAVALIVAAIFFNAQLKDIRQQESNTEFKERMVNGGWHDVGVGYMRAEIANGVLTQSFVVVPGTEGDNQPTYFFMERMEDR